MAGQRGRPKGKQNKKTLIALDKAENSFGAKMKQLRDQAGMSLNDLAQATGISESTLSRYENGTTSPQLGAILTICDALNVSYEAMVSEDPGALLENGGYVTDRATRLYLWKDFLRKAGYLRPRVSIEEKTKFKVIFELLEADVSAAGGEM